MGSDRRRMPQRRRRVRVAGLGLFLLVAYASPARAGEPTANDLRKAYHEAAVELVVAREQTRRNEAYRLKSKDLIPKFEKLVKDAEAGLEKLERTPRSSLTPGARKAYDAMRRLYRSTAKTFKKLLAATRMANARIDEELADAEARATKFGGEVERLAHAYAATAGAPLPEANSLLEALAAICADAQRIEDRYAEQAKAVKERREKLEAKSEPRRKDAAQRQALAAAKQALRAAVRDANKTVADFEAVVRRWSKLAKRPWFDKHVRVKRLKAK